MTSDMKVTTTKDNLARIILCSDLGYDPNNEKTFVRPFTVSAWNKIEAKLTSARLTPSALFELLDKTARDIGLTTAEEAQIGKLLLRADKLSGEIERLVEMKIFITTRTADNYPTKLLRL
ncbi:hypothetical protein FACS189499_05030 [Clostridia bacterium]|nr:hypothetical protein FACS189499_05030 [Clostridia bacterium]